MEFRIKKAPLRLFAAKVLSWISLLHSSLELGLCLHDDGLCHIEAKGLSDSLHIRADEDAIGACVGNPAICRFVE